MKLKEVFHFSGLDELVAALEERGINLDIQGSLTNASFDEASYKHENLSDAYWHVQAHKSFSDASYKHEYLSSLYWHVEARDFDCWFKLPVLIDNHLVEISAFNGIYKGTKKEYHLVIHATEQKK